MAFIDLEIPEKHPAEAYSTDGSEIDLVHYKYTRVGLDLLPPGRAFTRRVGTRLQRLVAGVGMEFSRKQRGIRQMLREASPATATKSLSLWETLLGLPDCEEPTTLAGRRKVAATKLGAIAGHTQELAFWEDLFKKLGYEINSIVGFNDFIADCEDPCDVGLFDELWLFVAWLYTTHGADDELLECQLKAEELLGFSISLKWSWEIEDISAVALRGVATSQDGWTVAVGLDGEVQRSKEFLTDWTLITDGVAPMDLLAVTCAGGSVFVAVGEAGQGCLRSTNSGLSWEQVADFGAGGALYGVSRGYHDNDDVIAVGAGGEIWKSSDGGETWTEKTSPVATDLRAVTRADGVLVAVGNGGKIVWSDDAGETWVEKTSGVTDQLRSVTGWGSVLVAVGTDGSMIRSTNGGDTWAAVASGTSQDLHAVVASPSGRWTACGSSGDIVHSSDEGATWTLTNVLTGDLMGAGYGALLGRAVLVGSDQHVVLE